MIVEDRMKPFGLIEEIRIIEFENTEAKKKFLSKSLADVHLGVRPFSTEMRVDLKTFKRLYCALSPIRSHHRSLKIAVR